MASRRGFAFWQALGFGILLAGCNPVEWAKEQWLGLRGGGETASPPTSVRESDGSQKGFDSAAAQRAKANAELLGEMLHVIFVRPPQDRTHFGSLVDSLNQGASLEGIYNGLTRSSEYRKLEVANPGSSERALKVFAETLVELSAELPSATVFGEGAAKPLALPVSPGVQSGVDEVEFSNPEVESAEGYARRFQGASIFTLKRVLGDEALKLMEHLGKDQQALSAWYAKWVVGMAQRGVDFGLPSRNSTDLKFHQDWSGSVDQDRLTWEVLNRLHRVLNDAQKRP